VRQEKSLKFEQVLSFSEENAVDFYGVGDGLLRTQTAEGRLSLSQTTARSTANSAVSNYKFEDNKECAVSENVS
jgi:hypothetical protein